jgi:hypothetical protein
LTGSGAGSNIALTELDVVHVCSKKNVRNGILSLAIKDKAVLYAAYMPFVKNGGLFISTKK